MRMDPTDESFGPAPSEEDGPDHAMSPPEAVSGLERLLLVLAVLSAALVFLPLTAETALFMEIDPEARSSMWEDLKRGRRTEIGSLQGVITEIADRRGLEAPLSRRIVQLVRKAEAGGKGSPGLTPEQIRGA